MPPTARTFLCAAFVATSACAPLYPGVPGRPDIIDPAIDGTIYAIFFENENANNVIHSGNPTFWALAQEYATAEAYISDVHPSLANYIMLTSGETHGISNSNAPASNVHIPGTDNLADQLDGAGISWRAYMESMETPCRMENDGLYVVNHNPFLYYDTMASDPARCRERVVDFDAHFTEDLAADRYALMWVMPNQCNNMHDCPPAEADAWLARVVPEIMASPGYQRGGAIFILFDEGHLRIGSAAANLPTIIVSDRLAARGMRIQTRYGHPSFLATVEDHFDLSRIPTTVGATPMGEFFLSRAVTLGGSLDAGL